VQQHQRWVLSSPPVGDPEPSNLDLVMPSTSTSMTSSERARSRSAAKGRNNLQRLSLASDLTPWEQL
jgi:hypothetical protein